MITRTITNGMFRTSVSYDKPVPSCPYGSCGIIELPNVIHLISYTTVCGELTDEGWLTARHYSSMTTAKHINAFIKDYIRQADPTFNYKDWKKLVDKHIAYNIYTGEIKELG